MRRLLTYILAALPLLLMVAVWWLYAPDKPRASLEARHATAPSQFLDVANLRLHLRDTGPRGAPAVIFLHGFASSLHPWEAVAAGLEPDFRVIRLDLPGFGLDFGAGAAAFKFDGVLRAIGFVGAGAGRNSCGKSGNDGDGVKSVGFHVDLSVRCGWPGFPVSAGFHEPCFNRDLTVGGAC